MNEVEQFNKDFWKNTLQGRKIEEVTFDDNGVKSLILTNEENSIELFTKVKNTEEKCVLNVAVNEQGKILPYKA